MPISAAAETDSRPWPAYTVERKPMAWLKPYAKNARTHGKAQIEQIRGSLKQFGWTIPVLAREDGTIIAGHGRVEAGKLEGIAEVPVIIATGWTETQCRAYALADNRVALNSGWDEQLLGVELQELSGLGIDLGTLGFDAVELAAQSGAGDGQGLTDPDAAPEAPATPTSARGDLWVLGKHRLLCGDCCNQDDVVRVMSGTLADMIFTDPPYGVAYADKGSAKQSISGDLTQATIPISFKQAIDHATKPNARLYFCGGSSNVLMYYSLFDAYLRKIPAMIIWNKGSIVLRRNNYHSQYEILFYGWKGAGGANDCWFGPRTADCAADVWDVKRDNSSDYLHPTQKPAALAVRAIGNSAPPHGVVYEPFSGSGSTMVAAEMTGRCCHAIEIDPAYVDVCIKRWQDFTGQKATLDGDGRTFEQIAAERLPKAA